MYNFSMSPYGSHKFVKLRRSLAIWSLCDRFKSSRESLRAIYGLLRVVTMYLWVATNSYALVTNNYESLRFFGKKCVNLANVVSSFHNWHPETAWHMRDRGQLRQRFLQLPLPLIRGKRRRPNSYQILIASHLRILASSLRIVASGLR